MKCDRILDFIHNRCIFKNTLVAYKLTQDVPHTKTGVDHQSTRVYYLNILNTSHNHNYMYFYSYLSGTVYFVSSKTTVLQTVHVLNNNLQNYSLINKPPSGAEIF